MASHRRRALAVLAASAALGAPLLAVGGVSAQTVTPSTAEAKGAQTYCFLRNNGNDHATSWNAAYAQIKLQRAGLFKTSPTQAAVMITETVVQNPGNYPDCGRYLGDLFNHRAAAGQAGAEPVRTTPAPAGEGSMTRSERYAN